MSLRLSPTWWGSPVGGREGVTQRSITRRLEEVNNRSFTPTPALPVLPHQVGESLSTDDFLYEFASLPHLVGESGRRPGGGDPTVDHQAFRGSEQPQFHPHPSFAGTPPPSGGESFDGRLPL